MDVLLDKNVLTTVQDNTCEKCKKVLKICVALSSTPGSRKELCVRVTDPENAFMLYSLKLNEDDYHNLKTQQGLLIDFPSFPSKFIELIKYCDSGIDKFELHLQTHSTTAVLQVVEVNPFKHLVHLALSLSTASDAVVKKYLAECLRDLQTQHTGLREKSETNEKNYTERIEELSAQVESLKTKLQGAESSKDLQLSEQGASLQAEIQKERDTALQEQRTMQERFQLNLTEHSNRNEVMIKQLEARVADLDSKCKKMFEEKCRYELQNRELIAKVKMFEESSGHQKVEMKRMQNEKTTLHQDFQALQVHYHEKETQLAVSQTEIKDKVNVISSTQQLLRTVTEQKSKLEHQVDTQHHQCMKLENTVRSVGDEVVKGNEIISRLQNTLKSYRSKMKLKHMQCTQQEKLLAEKEEEGLKMKESLSTARIDLQSTTDSLTKTTNSKNELMEELDELQKTLKSNENVIAWLNKQINEKLSVGPRSLPSLLKPTSGCGVRPVATSSTPTLGHRGEVLYNAPGHPRQPPAPAPGHSYQHLSSVDRNTRDKNESLIDESYLRPVNENVHSNIVEDSLQTTANRSKLSTGSKFSTSSNCYIAETPESQVVTLGRKKALQEPNKPAVQRNSQRIPSSQNPKGLNNRTHEPSLMKAYAPK